MQLVQVFSTHKLLVYPLPEFNILFKISKDFFKMNITFLKKLNDFIWVSCTFISLFLIDKGIQKFLFFTTSMTEIIILSYTENND